MIASVNKNENKIKVIFEEGEMRYHGVWLRHNCRCPQCYDYASENTLVRPQHLFKENNATDIRNVYIQG